MIYGQCYTPRMTSYESKTKQRSAPRNKGSDSGTLIGTLTPIVPPAGCLCFPLWSQACPQLIPWVNSPADIHSSSQVFTTARLFLLICFSSQTDWRAGPGGPASGREAAEGENILTRNPKAPRLTDCTRPGLLFTLTRCGLQLVFLRNYPSLTESMCQSKSLRVSAGPRRGHRERGR